MGDGTKPPLPLRTEDPERFELNYSSVLNVSEGTNYTSPDRGKWSYSKIISVKLLKWNLHRK